MRVLRRRYISDVSTFCGSACGRSHREACFEHTHRAQTSRCVRGCGPSDPQLNLLFFTGASMGSLSLFSFGFLHEHRSFFPAAFPASSSLQATAIAAKMITDLTGAALMFFKFITSEFIFCDLQGRKIDYTTSKTFVGGCRDRP